MPITPEITLAFQKIINSSSSTNVVEVVNVNNILNGYSLPSGYAFTDFSAFKIEALTACYILPSIKGVDVPIIYPEDDEGTKAAKWNENLELAPSKILATHIDIGDGVWLKRSQVNLQNHGKTNVGIYSYYPLMSLLINNGVGYFGKNQRVGFSVVTTPDNTVLGTNDIINIVGTIRAIPYLIEAPSAFTGSNNFSATVTSATPVQVLSARSNRKELRFTTTENIWFRFSNSSSGVAKNQCAMLTKGGALTYENGRLSFEGGRGDLISKNYTQGFALWAIADSNTAIVSGEEFW